MSEENKKKEENLEAAEKVAKAVKEKKKNSGKPKDAKPNIFVRMWKAIVRFFKDVKGETKKIVWPDGKTVFKNAGIVLIVIIVVGAFIWLVDFGLSKSINALDDLAAKESVSEEADEAETTTLPADASGTVEITDASGQTAEEVTE